MQIHTGPVLALKVINMIKLPFDWLICGYKNTFILFEKIHKINDIILIKLTLFVCDNNCNNEKFRNIDIIRRI